MHPTPAMQTERNIKGPIFSAIIHDRRIAADFLPSRTREDNSGVNMVLPNQSFEIIVAKRPFLEPFVLVKDPYIVIDKRVRVLLTSLNQLFQTVRFAHIVGG